MSGSLIFDELFYSKHYNDDDHLKNCALYLILSNPLEDSSHLLDTLLLIKKKREVGRSKFCTRNKKNVLNFQIKMIFHIR